MQLPASPISQFPPPPAVAAVSGLQLRKAHNGVGGATGESSGVVLMILLGRRGGRKCCDLGLPSKDPPLCGY